jgi:conjugal transfer/entry exclusion protein
MEITMKLPAKWVLGREKAQMDAQIRQLQKNAQKALEHLKNIPDLPELPAWDKLSSEWIDEIVQSKHALIDAQNYLPQEERTRLKQQWNLKRNMANMYIRAINAYIDDVGRDNIAYESNIDTIYTKDIEGIVTAKATHEVPEEAKEQWAMIANILNEVDKLRKWEDEHKVKSQPITTFQAMPLSIFLDAWVDGTVKFGSKYGLQNNEKHPDGLLLV